MIDFRYHLVSIIAIFFALATGIILGAGPFDERADEVVADQLASFRDRNQELQNQIVALEQGIEYQETFLQTVMPPLVDGQLDGQRILLVVTPGADDEQVDRLRDDIAMAGATVSATATIEPAWPEADSEAVLDELAAQLVDSGTTLPEGDGYDRGAAVLAGALLAAPDDRTGDVDAEVVAGFAEAGLATIDLVADENGDNLEATLALVAAGTPPDDDAERVNSTLRAVMIGLDAAGNGAVVTGPASSAGDNGLLTIIRDDGELRESVSTVDSTDLPSGGIAVIFAAVEQQGGDAGHYGRVGTTDGALPELAAGPEEGGEGS